MQIVLTNKNTLIFDEFKFKCVIGKKGITSKKKEGDLKTPKGLFSLGPLYFRKDRINNLETNLKKIPIKKEKVVLREKKIKFLLQFFELFWLIILCLCSNFHL